MDGCASVSRVVVVVVGEANDDEDEDDDDDGEIVDVSGRGGESVGRGWIERRRRAGEYGEYDGASGRDVVDVVVIGGAVGVIEWIARRARW